jgi:hypothetical protein
LSTEIKGKVIIRAIPDAAVKEKVVSFICTCGGKMSPEMVRARLERLPLVLAGSIEVARGERLAKSLQSHGADAVFALNEESVAPVAVPPVVEIGAEFTARPEPLRQESPDRPDRRGPRGARGKALPPTPEAEKLRIAHAVRIVLVYALLACLVAMVTPLFHLFSVPFALYAAHRASALLETDIWLRSIYLPGIFVPLLNILILALLLLQIHLFLHRSRAADKTGQDELAPLRFGLRVGYAIIMALFLIGTASGYIPDTMNDFRETVERRLAKEVARSAKQFPKQVDKDLRVDKMTAGPDKQLTFHCTLLNYKAKMLDPERFRSGISEKIVKQVCEGKEMQYYLNKEVVVAYAFYGNDALPITTVSVVSSDCKK